MAERVDAFTVVQHYSEHPDESIHELADGILWLCGYRDGRPKWLWFLCPCGCGRFRALPLMPSARPHWNLTETTAIGGPRITVSPSIKDIGGCGAHFFIRDNAVVWCELPVDRVDCPSCQVTSDLLRRIAYPRRGTSEESATLQDFADEIQARYSLDDLGGG